MMPPLAALGVCLSVAVPQSALASVSSKADPGQSLRTEIGRRAPKELRGFYASRGNRPLWIDSSGRPLEAATLLLDQLWSAELDGLQPRKLKPDDLAKALRRAENGRFADLARAELALSSAYIRYVTELRQMPRAAMIYETQALAPVVPTPAAALESLSASPSLDEAVRTMNWMTPLYAPLRAALDSEQLTPDLARVIAINLARLRALPAIGSGRWVLIDAASARLWMFEGAKPVGSMKVVVGKPDTQTPAMAGFLRYAIVNPYWNLPDDLVPSRVTDKVLKQGPGFIRANRFQLLSSWDDDAALIDPLKLDWQAVAAGRQSIRVRQLPGRGNFMGAVKFMFPNPQGIYLHDTPERDLLKKNARQFSNGCVRLEDALRFGRWILGRPLPRSKTPETRIALPVIVPIYITYLTALPEAGQVTFRPDVYGRDRAMLAAR